jgi:hypothetical protein
MTLPGARDTVVLLLRNPDGSYVFGAATPSEASNPTKPLWLQEDEADGSTRVVALVTDAAHDARVITKDGSTVPADLSDNVLSADVPAGAVVSFDVAAGSVALAPTPRGGP